MKKFQNKYRIASARLQNWDYGSNAAYFITICSKNREHFFGEIENNEMALNAIGKLAEQYWIEIPKHFSFIELGNFVVMPNHVHGILIIDKIGGDPTTADTLQCVDTLQCNVSTTTNPTKPPIKNVQMAMISPKPGTISTIIRSYKSVVTKNARLIDVDFGWQSRFHDHIIRNDGEYQRISEYIFNNPANWQTDKFHRKKRRK
ncbi:MAG: hypothetical protein PF484_08850 [Bacteroidales bacterium]|jgi:putative transposase|nr:hypothetical protein [Bacteroidales bacterium]